MLLLCGSLHLKVLTSTWLFSWLSFSTIAINLRGRLSKIRVSQVTNHVEIVSWWTSIWSCQMFMFKKKVKIQDIHFRRIEFDKETNVFSNGAAMDTKTVIPCHVYLGTQYSRNVWIRCSVKAEGLSPRRRKMWRSVGKLQPQTWESIIIFLEHTNPYMCEAAEV